MMPLPYPLIEGYLEELGGLRDRWLRDRWLRDRRLRAKRAPARFVRWCGRCAAAVRSRAGSVQRGHAPDVGSLHGNP